MLDDILNDLFDVAGEDIIDVDRTVYERAPFGMPGGKVQCLDRILPKLQVRDKWIEHFGGSGVISWNRPKVPLMVFNDRYSGIAAFYRVLQSDRWDELVHFLRDLVPPSSREEWIYSRANWATERDDVRRAARWFYMIKNSVIGKGQAFARSTNGRSYVPLATCLQWFAPLHAKLKQFQIENLHWEVCFNDYDSLDCVHYFDPPYVGTDTGIYEHKWHKGDLNRLLNAISRAKGFCALSHYPNETIDACDFWDDRFEWEVNVTSEVMAFTEENNKIDQQKDGYAKTKEVLWLKW